MPRTTQCSPFPIPLHARRCTSTSLLLKSHATTHFSWSCPAGTCLIESTLPSGSWNVGMRFTLYCQTQRVVLSFAWHCASRLSPHHRCGDLWILVASEAVRDMLISSIHEWLPQLSDGLIYIPKTYPVLIRSVPTSFDTSRDSPNINALLDVNLDIIPHPSTLHHADFLIYNPSHLQHKTHSSVVLHFMDPTVANDCIAHQVSLHGWLLSTVKFIQHPPRCYSCHQLGHFAQACKLKWAWGLHTDAHDTCSCEAVPSNHHPYGRPEPMPSTRHARRASFPSHPDTYRETK